VLDLIKTRGIQITEKDAKFMDLLETPENPLQRGVQLAAEKDRLLAHAGRVSAMGHVPQVHCRIS